MDNLTYSYKPNTNQVHKVVDITADASAANYPKYNDIRTGQLNNNYVYDANGNLIQDVKDYPGYSSEIDHFIPGQIDH